MDWKAEALARVRRARLYAINLDRKIEEVTYSLCELVGYDDEYSQARDASHKLNHIIRDLFDLEGKLSQK